MYAILGAPSLLFYQGRTIVRSVCPVLLSGICVFLNSGESGAGKTESTKLLLKFLSAMSQCSLGGPASEKSTHVEEAIMESRYGPSPRGHWGSAVLGRRQQLSGLCLPEAFLPP